MDVFPLDYDLLSLESESAFYDLYITQNLNILSILDTHITHENFPCSSSDLYVSIVLHN